MKTEVTLREVVKGEKELCPVCNTLYGKTDEKRKIISYGSCSLCLLEKQLGHPYCPRTWNCSCGKKFMSKNNLERHQDRYDHLEKIEQEEIK